MKSLLSLSSSDGDVDDSTEPFSDNPLNSNLASGKKFIVDDNENGIGNVVASTNTDKNNYNKIIEINDSGFGSGDSSDSDYDDSTTILLPTSFKRNKNKSKSKPSKKSKRHDFNNLMVNDGLVPLDNVEIISLTNETINSSDEYKIGLPTSTENVSSSSSSSAAVEIVPLRKSRDKKDKRRKDKKAKLKKKLSSSASMMNENDVVKIPQIISLDPEPYIPGKRILVNLSIATDAGTGTKDTTVYQLHVSVPAAPVPDEDDNENDIDDNNESNEIKDADNGIVNNRRNNYCMNQLLQPPPRMPDCPPCPCFNDDFTNDIDNSISKSEENLENFIPTATSTTTTTTTTSTSTTPPSTTISSSIASSQDVLACPDVPILILEGDLAKKYTIMTLNRAAV